MFKHGLLILILYFTGCKPIDKAVSTVFADMLVPGFNPDLLQLQLGLYQYKLTNQIWPNDSIELNEFLKNIGMEPIRTNKYEVLDWSSKGDTVEVTYLVRYNESDSIRFKSLKGGFNLYIDNDSTLHSVHRKLIAEKKNTLIEMDGEWKIKIEPTK